MNKLTKETINVVYKKDIDTIPNIAPSYIINKVNYQEQILIKKVKELYNKGIDKKEIVKITGLNKHLINEYLKKSFYLIEPNTEIFEISYLPSTYLNHLEELNDKLCYDFDDFDEMNKSLYENVSIKYELEENGLYKLGEKIYKIKRKKQD